MTAHRPAARYRGFTLIEIIVVVGIIAVLAAMIVPAVMTAQKRAIKTKAAAELIAIGTALDAYKADFGDIPRGPKNIGFAVLAKALLSPGPSNGPLTPGASPYPAGSVYSTGSGNTYQEHVAYGSPDALGALTVATPPPGAGWADFFYSDGKDGPGFRARSGGKTYPGYLPPDKFKLRGLAILDAWGNPILYFPARPGKVAQAPGWRLIGDGINGTTPAGVGVYDLADNIAFFERYLDNAPANAMKRMSASLVKDPPTGYLFSGIVPNGASAATTRDFLLWSAGPDNKYGVSYQKDNPANQGNFPTKDEIGKNDDIANFKE